MVAELSPRVFTASEATHMANQVTEHDPDTPRALALVPGDEAAAEASVRALVDRLHGLPKSIRSALKRAADSAGHLSDDRLQGLAELIQNADDLGATEATVAVDHTTSRLLFSHNGAALTLHDVWALAIPWLSLKVADEEQVGRFGIGLKTLHALSDILEVYQGHFRLRFDANTIVPLSDPISWPEADTTPTTFAIPFTPGAITSDDAMAWLRHWDDAGLVFLRQLSLVRLVDDGRRELLRLQLEYSAEEKLELPHGAAVRRRVRAPDAREWLVYTRHAPSPTDFKRTGKAQGAVTPLAVAFPQFDGDVAHVHVGLPVRPIGLPFRFLAQFDPQPTRRDIADTDWNLALIPPFADLWQDAALHLFQEEASRGWAVVPLAAELDADERTRGRIRAQLDEHLMDRARTKLATELALDGLEADPLPLADLAYEAPELTWVLSAEDVRAVASQPGALAAAARSADDRWRKVLDELRQLHAPVPVLVGIEDATALLSDEARAPEFVANLVTVAIEAGYTAALESYACLVLEDGTRVPPDSRSGLRVLLPARRGALWGLLGMGAGLHQAFTEHPRWGAVRQWLSEHDLLRLSATDADALRTLADAGNDGEQLPNPLTDEQVDGIRRALEAIADTQRPALGQGIGHAVKVDAFTTDPHGAQHRVHARPCEAYFVEREANAWWIAAGRTPGLVWIDRRYTSKLRTGGSRESIGAQRLFRLLGTEVAPRIERHPANSRRFVHYPPGVPRWAQGSPRRREVVLGQHQATYTVQDWIARDLDAVLADIAKERDTTQRRRRAGAVLATLSRAWDRLRDYATVQAADDNRGWVDKGRVEAWWLCSAASMAWLTSERGNAAPPDELRIKSSATVALYGDDRERYLDPSLDIEAYHEVLARLGVAGDPTAQELIAKLEEVRSRTASTPHNAEDLAAPLYQALAAQVGRAQRLGRMTASAARQVFSRGDGLIATRGGWRRPSVVLAGPPIFGDMRDFVPSVSGTDPLWELLAVQRPTYRDARSVLGELARKRSLSADEKLVMLEALRLLIGAPTDELAKLKRTAVWVGHRWERRRPVYATHNPLMAEALKGRVSVWEPGGALAQLDPLVEAYGLTRLDTPHSQVLNAADATYDAELTQVFSRAVANLRADLSLSDPEAEQSLKVSWEDLAALTVMQLPNLQVRLHEPMCGLDETVELGTWLDPRNAIFYVADEDAAGSPNLGAYAVASVFSGDSRRIAHDWVAAWAIASQGHRAEAIKTAARLDAERKQERDQRGEERLRALARQGRHRRARNTAEGKTSAGDSKRGRARPAQTTVKLTRQLVDPDQLSLRNEDGQIIDGKQTERSTAPQKDARKPNGKPKPPDPSNPKKTHAGRGQAVRNYTDEERESVGLELVRRILGGNEEQVVDIRHQRSVGADAIDDLRNFFELKVYAGSIPDNVSLTSAEFRRAQETEQFFLVVVGNVERGIQCPEVRIITDPLNHLKVLPQGSVSLRGVRDAQSLRYTFDSTSSE